MPLPEHLEEQVAVGMYDRGLLVFPEGGMRTKSGRLSPYYYNARPSLSVRKELDRNGQMSLGRQYEFRKALVGAYATQYAESISDVDHVFGKAQAVTAIAGVAAYEAGLSYLWERIIEPGKTYGNHQRIEGDYERGEQVLVADDVVTDGKSKLEGMQLLRGVGLVPVAVTLQFDREEGGAEMLLRSGLEVNTVTSLSRATRFLFDNHRIGTQEVDALQAYHDGLRADNIATTFYFGG